MKLVKPALLLRAEKRLRPLDFLPRNVAVGAGLAAGVSAGALAGWTGETWAFGVAAGTLAVAGWLGSSGEAVSVVVEKTPRALAPSKPRVSAPLGMKAVPGGEFWMGTAEEDQNNDGDESPRHREIVAPIEVARYLVRQSLYETVMGLNPSDAKGADLPVQKVRWFDAIRFCNALSRSDGCQPAYSLTGDPESPSVEWDRTADGFRLPTEAEWEYAARAGTETAWSFGDDEKLLHDHAWWGKNAKNTPHPVGTKLPNPWGLFDVHGNVYEWCWDVYGAYGEPRPSVGGRVVRGGSFRFQDPWDLRSASRGAISPELRRDVVGFRCVRGGSRQP